MSTNDLLAQLRSKREDYEHELVWHRFLLDAYTGTGGFAGRIKQPPTAFLGWAASAYSDSVVRNTAVGSSLHTYLDRYPREDETKFERRLAVAHYPNFAEMVIDILVSFIVKRGLDREKVPEPILEWMSDIDGEGTSWDELVSETQVVRSALLGWTPILFDAPQAPATPEGATRAQTDAAGVRPRALPLYPANLLDWELKDGAFAWIKLRLEYTERPDPLGDCIEVEEYQIWERDKVRKWLVKKSGNQETVEPQDEVQNPFGTIPIVVWKHKPSPECRVRGLGMIDGIAPLIRRLFNLVSELDEHIRSNVFAVLQVPYDPNASGDSNPKELVIGTDNALPLPSTSKHQFSYVAPPASVAETLETRIANTIVAIFWLARLERQDASKQVQSGISKAYDFEKTNRRLGDFAKQLAKADKASLMMIGRVLNLTNDVLEEMTVTPPSDFRVEDLASDLANALSSLELGLPPSVEYWIRTRVVRKMLPNLPEDEWVTIEEELRVQRDEAIRRFAEDGEIDDAAAEGEEESDGEDGEDAEDAEDDGGEGNDS